MDYKNQEKTFEKSLRVSKCDSVFWSSKQSNHDKKQQMVEIRWNSYTDHFIGRQKHGELINSQSVKKDIPWKPYTECCSWNNNRCVKTEISENTDINTENVKATTTNQTRKDWSYTALIWQSIKTSVQNKTDLGHIHQEQMHIRTAPSIAFPYLGKYIQAETWPKHNSQKLDEQ